MKELIRTNIGAVDFAHLVMRNLAIRIAKHIEQKRIELVQINFDAFLVSAREHFAEEEKEMAAAGYVDLEAHRWEHYVFVEHLFRFRDQVYADQPFEMLSAAFEVLCGEMMDHMNGKDQDAAALIKPKE